MIPYYLVDAAPYIKGAFLFALVLAFAWAIKPERRY